ncbi:ABC transporter substrate-binding protein [Desulfovibrio sp. UCD-KL4C]|uniref:substrate-binding periplasmic protein n=1 Tax=Desulfovibrio sp. UCD-KL4C TaxID=2578120 RepID=UPI0025C10F4E|nr:ABC transporter substrate-binding protein [Desulfovibrio sp. UCD-KL4C]
MRKLFIAFTLILFLGVSVVYAAELTIITENSPPLNYKKNGKIIGVSTELVQEIMRRTNKVYPIKVMPWARGYALALKKPNVVLYSTVRTRSRENLFKWVGPIATLKWVLFAKSGSGLKISNWDDAKKVGSIGTYIRDARELMLKARGFTNLKSAPDSLTNLKKLMADRIDLWVVGENEGYLLAKQNGFSPSDLEKVFVIREVNLYIAFSKSTSDTIVNVWRKAFGEMIDDGFVQKTWDKWAKLISF